jgi:hypothetical protein
MDSIIYSDPFDFEKEFDHQYRITINDNNLELDHIKCNEDTEIEECVILVNNIVKLPIEEVKKKIKDDIDIRNGKKMTDNYKNKIDKQSNICMKELYEYLTNNIFN